MRHSLSIASLAALLPATLAQQSAWGQCGGKGWTGATTCVSGYYCKYSDAYYSQCVPGTSTSTTTTTSSTSTGCTTTACAWTQTVYPGGATTPPPPYTVTSTVYTGTINCPTGCTTTSTSTVTSTTVITVTSTTSSTSASPTSSGLNDYAKAAGKLYFGSATDNPELTDAPYVAILSDIHEFGQITPGNSMKWDATEPSRGTFTFTKGDVIAQLAESNGQLLRGHNCVWHNQLPSWVSSGGFNASELTSIIQTHCGTVVSHYAGQIYSWDVVNEPFNEDGTLQSNVFYDTIGTDYIKAALVSARAADPKAKLYINDYNIEGTGAKSTGMINLVSSLKSAGVPIDGIGLQAHFIVGSLPGNIIANMQAMTALGVEIAITELDVRMTLPVTDALLAQQKADYQRIITGCQAVAGCIGVTIWDYTDKYSWVPSTFSGQGAALPWDENLVKKPAYDGIIAGFGF